LQVNKLRRKAICTKVYRKLASAEIGECAENNLRLCHGLSTIDATKSILLQTRR